MSRTPGVFLTVLIGSLMVVCPVEAGIIGVNGTAPDGRTYSQLAAAWWQWAISIPSPQNPLTDGTGIHAAVGQQGDVWFLAPSIGNDYARSVDVPGGKYLFFPVVSVIAFNGPEESYSESELRAQLDDLLGTTSVLYATLNGEQLPNLWNHRASSAAPFSVTVPDDNIFGIDGGIYGPPTVADGWWLLLAPLPEGKHILRFEGGTGNPDEPTLYQGVTYEVYVPEPGIMGLAMLGAILLASRRR